MRPTALTTLLVLAAALAMGGLRTGEAPLFVSAAFADDDDGAHGGGGDDGDDGDDDDDDGDDDDDRDDDDRDDDGDDDGPDDDGPDDGPDDDGGTGDDGNSGADDGPGGDDGGSGDDGPGSPGGDDGGGDDGGPGGDDGGSGGDDGGSDDGGPGGDDGGGDDGGPGGDDGGGDDGPGPGAEAGDGGRDPSAGRDRVTAPRAPTLIERLFTGLGTPDGGRDFVSDEIVLLGIPGFSQAERAALDGAGFPVISETALGALGGVLVRLGLPAGLDLEAALAEARALAPSAILDLNHLYRQNGAVCGGPDCWGPDAVRLAALPATACRRGAPVAILDGAVDRRHPALAGARVVVRSFLPDGVADAPSDHGTAVAALLVGESSPGARPLAPGARLLAATVFRETAEGVQADATSILRGIDWALGEGARVIAMSLAGPPNRALAETVWRAAAGANLVAAAGNAGPNAGPAYPAAYPEVIAVAAVDRRLRPYRQGTRGSYVEIAAPGVDIVSAAPGGGWQAWSGTSFAVPFVAAALLRARAETAGDPIGARLLIAKSARDLGAPGHDEIYGHGLLQTPGSRCW